MNRVSLVQPSVLLYCWLGEEKDVQQKLRTAQEIYDEFLWYIRFRKHMSWNQPVF